MTINILDYTDTDYTDYAEIEALYTKMQELHAEAGAIYATINAATNDDPDTEVEALRIKADAIYAEAEEAYASYMEAVNDINFLENGKAI